MQKQHHAQTNVGETKLKSGIDRNPASDMPAFEPKGSSSAPSPKRFRIEGRQLLIFDKLVRNIAVMGALLLVVVAAKNAWGDDAQSVFAGVKSAVSMDWDESLGKLSFVSNLLPKSVQAVWSEQTSISISAPVTGEVTHAWSEQEPYTELESVTSEVHAVQNGEVMSIAHGLDEELILRVRHDDGTESLYGNLATCFVDEGAYVFQGDVIAQKQKGKPLAFELRQDGRSIDPSAMMKP